MSRLRFSSKVRDRGGLGPPSEGKAPGTLRLRQEIGLDLAVDQHQLMGTWLASSLAILESQEKLGLRAR